MRSDYALYTVAIILFILTGVVLAYSVEFRELWTVTTAVLGLLFIGLGYSLRPKSHATMVSAPPPAPVSTPPSVQPTVSVTTETVEETQPEIPIEIAPPKILELTKVKGIGEKRAGQLKDLGISTIEELATASAKDLAAKLKISPKITGKWIDNAKELVEK
jgi:predicted flap endonuclease-1-like 5' DNA nuclease